MVEFWKSKGIAERFELIQELGKGGIGTVFLARDKTLDKHIAIKVLNTNLTPEQSIRFQQEGKLSGRLKHENIVSVLDFGVTEENIPYLVMEYLPGISLQQRVTECGALDLLPALDIFLQISQGMAKSHERGVLHRDLKPANIILLDNDDGTCTAKIVDFGVAKLKEVDGRLTPTGDPVGSPVFMSPEQADGKKDVDERSDIYSMGCLMYQTLTGKPPFLGDSSMETILKHKTEIPERLSSKGGKTFPPSIEEVVAKCLNKKTDERYAGFGQLFDALYAIAVEETPADKAVIDTRVGAEPLPPMIRLRPSDVPSNTASKNHHLIAVVTVVLLVSGLLIPIFVKPPIEEAKQIPVEEDAMATSLQVASSFVDTPPVNGLVTVKTALEANTDGDMKQLIKHGPIQHLNLAHSVCTGIGFHYLKDKAIPTVTLDSCPVSEVGIKQVAKIKGLDCLYMESCNTLKDDYFKYLAENPTLSHLIFSGEELTENALEYLKSNPRICYLNFKEIPLTSKGAKALVAMKGLSYVNFGNCRLSTDAVNELRKSDKFVDLGFGDYDLSNNDKTLPLYLSIPAKSYQLLNVSISKAVYEKLLRAPRNIYWSHLTVDNRLVEDHKRPSSRN